MVSLAAGGVLVQYGLTSTTAFVVRHAEKAAGEVDPPLTLEGSLRAQKLAHVVEAVNVTAAYCTQYRRTRQTVELIATQAGISITEIPKDEITRLVDDVLTNHSGQTVVIVGHSDTAPLIVREFGGRALPPIGENEYDNLYAVTIHELKALRVLRFPVRKVYTLHLKYGSRT